jgi:type IV secretion system protein VirB6
MACETFDPAAGYVLGLTAFVDCRVQELGEAGYLALAADGSPVRLALTGLVAILVALIGYRLMFGERFEVRHGVLTAVRLGIVLALCTQWPAYQALVYKVVIDGPAELASSISAGEQPDVLPARIEGSYRALEAIAHPRPAGLGAATQPQSGGAVPTPPVLVTGGLTIEEQKRLSTGSVVLLVSSLGALLSVRVAAGLLLALGPLFAACLLFDGLRGWFEGWVRGLAGAMVGSVAASTVLVLELAVLEPQLIELTAGLQAGLPRPGASTEVFATTLLFAVVAAVTMLLVTRAAAGFRLPAWGASIGNATARSVDSSTAPPPALAAGYDRVPFAQNRAQQVVEALQSADRRMEVRATSSSNVERLQVGGGRGPEGGDRVVPLGRTYRRSQPAVRAVSVAPRNGMA